MPAPARNRGHRLAAYRRFSPTEMRLLPTAIGLMVCTSCGGTSRDEPPGRVIATDVAVFEAVVREHDTSGRRSRVVADQTLAVCAPSQHLSQCIGDQEVQRLSEIGYRGVEERFMDRNRRRVPIGSEVRGELRLLSIDAVSEIRGRVAYPPNLEIVEVGLPVYPEPNLALVYVRYDCGKLCGGGWYVQLRKESGAWHVASEWPLWVS